MRKIYKTSSQLKEKARNQLTGNYGTAIAMQLLIQALGVGSGTLIGIFFPASSTLSYVLQLLITFGVSAAIGVASMGVTLYYLNLACGGSHTLSNLWFGFQNQFSKSFVLSLVVTAITFVYQVVIEIPLNLYTSTADITYLFISFPVLMVAVVIYFYLSLIYAPVFYLALDYPTYSAAEILKLSPKVMKGHKGRLLYIELSFLPLIFLSFLTCGIALFWVNAYRNMTMTNFYLDLMNPETHGHEQ